MNQNFKKIAAQYTLQVITQPKSIILKTGFLYLASLSKENLIDLADPSLPFPGSIQHHFLLDKSPPPLHCKVITPPSAR